MSGDCHPLSLIFEFRNWPVSRGLDRAPRWDLSGPSRFEPARACTLIDVRLILEERYGTIPTMKRLSVTVGLVLLVLLAVKGSSGAERRNTAQITYDANGRPLRVVDAADRSISLIYCNDDRTHACEVRWSNP